MIVNQPIRVEYQPVGGTSGLTVNTVILDENGVTDEIDFPIFPLTELPIAGKSMYQGEFTPDTVGTWSVYIVDSDGGTAIKQYVVVKDIENMLAAPVMVA